MQESWPSDNDLSASTSTERYVLRLYVAGTTPRSATAIVNVRRFCEEYLSGNYDLEVIDVIQSPSKAAEGQIIAAPTLVKESPLPIKRFIGDMSMTRRLLDGLGISPA
jgi:circadian clock protein KaiB